MMSKMTTMKPVKAWAVRYRNQNLNWIRDGSEKRPDLFFSKGAAIWSSTFDEGGEVFPVLITPLPTKRKKK